MLLGSKVRRVQFQAAGGDAVPRALDLHEDVGDVKAAVRRRVRAEPARRLAPYTPSHRGVDVAAVLAQVERAREIVAGGSLTLDPPQL